MKSASAVRQSTTNARVSRLLVAAILFVLPVCLASCGQSDPTTVNPSKDESKSKIKVPLNPFFEELAQSAGIQFVYENGEETNKLAILESLGGGGAIFDYDKDGKMDLFLVGGGYFKGPKDKQQILGRPCRLNKNLGNWKFRDVTGEAGLDVSLPYSHGAAVGDYNRDGWPDLVVTGFGKVMLFRNSKGMEGRRRFVDVSKEVGLTGDYHWPTSAAFADLDGDGWVDLYVCQYTDWSLTNHKTCKYSNSTPTDICPPADFSAKPDFVYRNDGKGRFIDVSKDCGVRIETKDKSYCGKGLAVLIVDVNNDQRPDIYVANDTTVNFLYLNQSENGTIKLSEEGEKWGVAVDGGGAPTGSMGIDAADIDGNGLPSLWVTNYEKELHAMYHLVKIGSRSRYFYKSQACGTAKSGNSYVGWGTAFADLQNDGTLDLIVSNGHVIRHPPAGVVRQKPLLYTNNGKGIFTEVSQQDCEYFRTGHRGRGLIRGDFDNNGLPDAAISHVKEPAALLRNICKDKNHWLGVHLTSKDHRDMTGAKITLNIGNKTLTRFQKSGGSYASSSDPRVLFGLGKSKTPDKLTVYWPSGQPRIEHWPNLAPGRYHTLIQGQGGN